MALQKEIWLENIKQALTDNDAFAAYAANHDSFIENKTVHVPNAGNEPTITRNRTVFPATVETRTDNDLTYDIDTFDFPPIRVGFVEDIELSYNKWRSVMGQSMNTLAEEAHDWLLYAWLNGLYAKSSSYIVTTTGTAAAANLIATSATGTRKPLLGTDLFTAAKVLDSQKAPMRNRYCQLDYIQYNNLVNDIGYQSGRDAVSELDQANGIVRKFAGFNILAPRTKVVFATANGATVRTPGHAGAATDSGMSICWQSDMVGRALGNIELFEARRDPSYYGDIVSGLIRLGGSRVRYDGKGVVGLLQGT